MRNLFISLSIFISSLSFAKDTVVYDHVMDTYNDTVYTAVDIECMTKNLYHEARGEGFPGMYAVAMVVMNRVQDPRYPDTVCGVVHQGKHDSNGTPVKHKCHFSWYCDGKSDRMPNQKLANAAKQITNIVFTSSIYKGETYVLYDITENSTHYHTIHVSPYWRNDRGMTLRVRHGSHIFYRWKRKRS